MPSFIHEAPLTVLREEPALIPTLLRESLGVEVPPFATAEIVDAGFTQVIPAELRADLVVHLRGGPPHRAPIMGIVVEVQVRSDDRKRRSWPLYLAALHARLRCPTCLVVIAADEKVARWAATPIATLQPGSPLVPLVLGPGRIPKLSRERARREPWLAVLSMLAHAHGPDGAAATIAVHDALGVMPRVDASFCYSLLRTALGPVEGRAQEDEMQPETIEYLTHLARRHDRAMAIREVLMPLADRHGPVSDELRERTEYCEDPDLLIALAVEIAGATDREGVERLLATIPEDDE